MNPTRPKGRPRMRNWIITLGLFLIVQLIFYAVDGTSWEPNLNDSRNLAGRMFGWLLNMKLLTEWIAPYSFPFLRVFVIRAETYLSFTRSSAIGHR